MHRRKLFADCRIAYGEESGSTELLHATTSEEMNTSLSYDIVDNDEVDMGNILVNASIG